jgi:hypothetical protein
MKGNEVKRKYMGSLKHFRKKTFKTDIDLCQEEEKELVQRIRNKKSTRTQNEILKNVTDFIMQSSEDEIKPCPEDVLTKRPGTSVSKIVVLNQEDRTKGSDENKEIPDKGTLDLKMDEYKMEKRGLGKAHQHKSPVVAPQKETRRSHLGQRENSFELEIVNEDKKSTEGKGLKGMDLIEDPKKPTLLQQIMEHVSKDNYVVKTNYYFDCRVTSLIPLKVTENYLNQVVVMETEELIDQIRKEKYNRQVLNLKIIFKNFEIINYRNINCKLKSKGVMIKLLDPHVYSIVYESSIKINFRIPFVEENEKLKSIYQKCLGYSLAHEFDSAVKASKLKLFHVNQESTESRQRENKEISKKILSVKNFEIKEKSTKKIFDIQTVSENKEVKESNQIIIESPKKNKPVEIIGDQGHSSKDNKIVYEHIEDVEHTKRKVQDVPKMVIFIDENQTKEKPEEAEKVEMSVESGPINVETNLSNEEQHNKSNLIFSEARYLTVRKNKRIDRSKSRLDGQEYSQRLQTNIIQQKEENAREDKEVEEFQQQKLYPFQNRPFGHIERIELHQQ